MGAVAHCRRLNAGAQRARVSIQGAFRELHQALYSNSVGRIRMPESKRAPDPTEYEAGSKGRALREERLLRSAFSAGPTYMSKTGSLHDL
jgi:hypothetical protein